MLLHPDPSRKRPVFHNRPLLLSAPYSPFYYLALPRSLNSKMYSDTILATNPSASIITLAQQEEAGRRDRAQAWNKTTPSLIDRMNGGGRRGRGQIGGGSYADMMVD